MVETRPEDDGRRRKMVVKSFSGGSGFLGSIQRDKDETKAARLGQILTWVLLF